MKKYLIALSILLSALNAVKSFAQCTGYFASGSTTVCPNTQASYWISGGNTGNGCSTISQVSGGYTSISGSQVTWGNTPGTYDVIIYCSSCGYVTIKVTVLSSTTVTAGSVAGKTICPNATGTTLTASGYSGSIIRWEKKEVGQSSYSSIAFTESTLTSSYINNQVDADYRIVVQSQCGAIGYSTPGRITVTPFQYYFLTGGANYCEGSSQSLVLTLTDGSAATANDSEASAIYKLKKDGVLIARNGTQPGDPKTGGGTVFWDNITESGYYTVEATKSGCTVPMTAGTSVTKIAQPLMYNVSGGGSICPGASSNINLSGSEANITYKLNKVGNPLNPVTSKTGTGSALSFTVSSEGTYNIVAERNGCSRTMNGQAIVTFFVPPSSPTFGEVRQFCGYAMVSKGADNASWYWLPGPSTYVETNNLKEIKVTSNQTVYLAVKGSNGCWSSVQSMNVVLSNTPPAITISPSASICSKGTTTLTASGSDVITFLWYDNTTGDLLGEGSSFITPQLTESMIFKVTGYDRKGCSTDKTVLVQVYSSPTVKPNLPKITKTGTQYYLDINNTNTSTSNFFWVSGPNGTETDSYANPRPVSGGYYYVRVRNQVGCWGPVTAIQVPDLFPLDPELLTSQSNVNYVRTYTYQDKNISGDIETLEPEKVVMNTKYYDGLGRPVQEVSKKGSPLKKDIVQPVNYDRFGREPLNFLPYIASSATGDVQLQPLSNQRQFYKTTANVAVSDYPVAVNEFEASALNKVPARYSPGEIWAGTAATTTSKGVKNAFLVNTAADRVKKFAFDATGIIGSVTDYPAGVLQVTKLTDENGYVQIQFTNNRGKVILKKVQLRDTLWTQTYYVYDDVDNLACVLPPEAVKGMVEVATSEYFGQSYAVRKAFLKKWAFLYKYDGRKRMVEKRIPGAGAVSMFYDPWDRVVLTQDSVQRSKKQYLYTKYDVLNRPILSGIWSSTNTVTQIQTGLDTLEQRRYESTSIAATTHGYTLTNTFPFSASSTDVLTVTYYDNYDFLNQSWFEETANMKYSYYTKKAGYPDSYQAAKGQVTAQKVKTLRGGKWLNTVHYYDDKNRIIRAISENPIGGADTVSTSYDFIGRVLTTLTEHSAIKATTIGRRFVYDHFGRLSQLYHKVDSGSEILLAENKYNDLGQLIDKGIGVTNGKPVQSIDYRYNIRGWLTNINKSDLSKDANGNRNDDDGDLFGMELYYGETKTEAGL
jgi:hypothetical protein